jgi:hypothetical protein
MEDSKESKTQVTRQINRVIDDVVYEFVKSLRSHGSINSRHEGWAVMKEEMDELWDEVKKRNCSNVDMRKEAVQVAAMAVRFILDVCDGWKG